MDITYTLTLTVTRPVRSYFYDDVQTPAAVAAEMVSAAAKRELEKEVLQALRKLDGDCDVEVMDTEAVGPITEDDEPCLSDGTPLFPSRMTRTERQQGMTDRGCDTLEEYRGER